MSLTTAPLTPEYAGAVTAFNRRLNAGGVIRAFPHEYNSEWIAPSDGRQIHHEFIIAREGDDVRGAYILKHQSFLIAGSISTVAQFRLPLSEGLVDKRYTSVGVQLLLDAMRRRPYLYTIGIGDFDDALTKMLQSAGWVTWAVPFYFRINRPARFLRNITYLRRTPLRRFALDLLAGTGVGSPLIHGYQWLRTRKHAQKSSEAAWSIEKSFGPWADAIWDEATPEYSLIAVRDAANLNVLYPPEETRVLKLKVTVGGRVVGWAALSDTPMIGHSYFGDMRVGSIIDALAVPGANDAVISAAMRYLSQSGADIVISNMSHRDWGAALQKNGCLCGPSNFILALSKKLAAALQPLAERQPTVHFSRGDGNGHENLISVRPVERYA